MRSWTKPKRIIKMATPNRKKKRSELTLYSILKTIVLNFLTYLFQSQHCVRKYLVLRYFDLRGTVTLH